MSGPSFSSSVPTFIFISLLFALGFFFSGSTEDDSVGVKDYRIEAGCNIQL